MTMVTLTLSFMKVSVPVGFLARNDFFLSFLCLAHFTLQAHLAHNSNVVIINTASSRNRMQNDL